MMEELRESVKSFRVSVSALNSPHGKVKELNKLLENDFFQNTALAETLYQNVHELVHSMICPHGSLDHNLSNFGSAWSRVAVALGENIAYGTENSGWAEKFSWGKGTGPNGMIFLKQTRFWASSIQAAISVSVSHHTEGTCGEFVQNFCNTQWWIKENLQKSQRNMLPFIIKGECIIPQVTVATALMEVEYISQSAFGFDDYTAYQHFLWDFLSGTREYLKKHVWTPLEPPLIPQVIVATALMEGGSPFENAFGFRTKNEFLSVFPDFLAGAKNSLEKHSGKFPDGPGSLTLSLASCDKLLILGDVHGNPKAVAEALRRFGYPGSFGKCSRFVAFLGDYVDRSINNKNLEGLLLPLVWQMAKPKHVFLLRGNHEILSICTMYGLGQEMKKRYKIFINDVTYKPLFEGLFAVMLPAMIVRSSTVADAPGVLLVHGSIPVELTRQANIEDRTDSEEVSVEKGKNKDIFTAMTISDFATHLQGNWTANGYGTFPSNYGSNNDAPFTTTERPDGSQAYGKRLGPWDAVREEMAKPVPNWWWEMTWGDFHEEGENRGNSVPNLFNDILTVRTKQQTEDFCRRNHISVI